MNKQNSQISDRAMSQSDKEHMVSIPIEEWADLRDVYRQDWPKGAYSYCGLDTYIQLSRKDLDLCKREVRIRSVDNNWREHGIFILDDHTDYSHIIRVDTCTSEHSSLFKLALTYMDLESCDEIIFRETIATTVRQYLQESGYPLKQDCYPRQLYYLSKEDSLKLQIRENADYNIKPLTLADVEEVERFWLYKRKGSSYIIRRNIKYNLTFGAYQRETGELCAWVLLNELGCIGFLYVKENYRRQGLAEHLVVHLCQALAKQDCDALAHIRDANVPSLKLFERLGFKAIEYNYWFIKEDIFTE
ncbi:uncharacterized protein LOC105209758 [Zeugodacus cucurbitae]|uniref:uncharacterized protein LOC105209758 n=1 Tax=Zeugodacus cucurbitae TaxID=28588 RepID=UPI00059689AD|nr:uncharacterized protein LOC105209758 [Zeugodacus cucurbitae]